MKDQTDKLSRSAALAAKGVTVLQKRVQLAREHFVERIREIAEAYKGEAAKATAAAQEGTGGA